MSSEDKQCLISGVIFALGFPPLAIGICEMSTESNLFPRETYFLFWTVSAVCSLALNLGLARKWNRDDKLTVFSVLWFAFLPLLVAVSLFLLNLSNDSPQNLVDVPAVVTKRAKVHGKNNPFYRLTFEVPETEVAGTTIRGTYRTRVDEELCRTTRVNQQAVFSVHPGLLRFPHCSSDPDSIKL